MFRALTIFQIFFLVLFQLSAADGDPAEGQSSPDVVRESLVVTAQFEPESSKSSVYRVKVLDRQDIEQRAASNLRELFQQELQASMKQHSVFGSSLSLSGVSSENVKILLDGVPVIGRLDGIIDLEQIGLSDIDRAEIIEGPVSVYYGTDAFGGVVNLISKPPAADSGAELGLLYRTNGEWEQQAQAHLNFGADQLAIHLGGSQFDGHDVNPANRKLDWSEREQGQGRLNWSHQFARLVLRYGGNYFEERLEELGEFSQGSAWDRRYETERASHQIALSGALDSRTYLEIQASYSDYQRKRMSTRIDLEGQILADSAPDDPGFSNGFDQEMLRGMISREQLFGKIDGQLGFEWSREGGEGGRLLDNSQSFEDRALFAGLRLRTNFGLTIQPALRWIDHSIYDAPLTPALNLLYQPNSNWTIRSSYSRGFRGPSLKQLYLDFTMMAGPQLYHIAGNEALKSERGDHYNLTGETRLLERKGLRLDLEGSLYHNEIEDLIALSTAAPDPAVPGRLERHYINVAKHKSRGGELALKISGFKQNWQLALGRTDTYNLLSGSAELPEYNPSWSGRAQWNYRLTRQGLDINAFYRYQGEQPGFVEVSQGRNQPNLIREVAVRDYHLFDTNASWKIGRSAFALQLGVKNLFDVESRNSEILATGAAHATNQVDWGRTFHLQLRWSDVF